MKFIVNYWYVPILVLIFLTGIILTIKLKGVQFRRLGKGLKLMLKSSNNEEGEISTFQALCISLSATLGTGNIIGVSTALALGGAGSLFWMFMFAVVGLATKYAEGYLAIKYYAPIYFYAQKWLFSGELTEENKALFRTDAYKHMQIFFEEIGGCNG